MSNQYKTTFNYLLTHKVMPQMYFSNLDFFYETIITKPKNLKIFIHNCMLTAIEMAENNPDIEPGSNPVWAAAEDFNMELMGVSVDKGIILVQIPRYSNSCDCIFVAFPCMRDEARYFTCELSSNPLTNETLYITGEWTPERYNYSHSNFGEIDANKKSFSDKVIKIVYGSPSTDVSSGDKDNDEEGGHNVKITKLVNMGWAYYRNGELTDALDCFNLLMDIKDNEALYFHCRSEIQRALGNDYKADYDLFRAKIIDMHDSANGKIRIDESEKGLEKRKPLIEAVGAFKILQNKEGKLLLSIKLLEGEVKLPELFYSGGKNILLRRRTDQYVLLDEIHEDVREILKKLDEVFIAESAPNSDLKDAEKKYTVPVRHLPENISLDSAETIRNDGYPLFASLASLVRANTDKPICEVIAKDDLPGLAAVLAREEDYALLDKYIAEDLPLNEKLGWWFKDWQPTPLFYITVKKVWSCMKDPVKMLTYLVNNHADPNLAGIEGDTPLGNQCYLDGSLEVIKALLDCGADPNIKTISSGTALFPLHLILLPDHYEKETHKFIPYGAIEVEKAKLLIEETAENVSGANVNAESGGMTPLGLAITYGTGTERSRLVSMLLNRGADVDYTITCMENYAKQGSPEYYYALYVLYSGFSGIAERKNPELANYYLDQSDNALRSLL